MSAPSPSVADRYRRVDDFETRAADMRLRPIEWRLALALDGQRTLGGIAQSLGIPPAEAVEIAAFFESIGLAETPRLSLAEYRTPPKPEPVAPPPQATIPRPPPMPAWPGSAPARMPAIEPIRPAEAPVDEPTATIEPAPEPVAPRITFSLRSRPPEPPPAEGA